MGCRMQHLIRLKFWIFPPRLNGLVGLVGLVGFAGLTGLTGITMIATAAYAAEVTSIDFKGTSDPNEISIQSNGPVTFEKQENQKDKQFIIELKGASISKNNARKIDTSSFNSKVSLISPYQVDGQKDTVRVVVQLREFVSADVSQDGNMIRIKVPSGTGPSTPGNQAKSDSGPNSGDDSETKTDTKADSKTADQTTLSGTSTTGSAATASQDGAQSEAQSGTGDANGDKKTGLDEFSDHQASGHFSGKPISLQLRDADLSDVFRLIGEASGFNIIVGDDVKGKITLSLSDVPWDQALEVVLQSSRLGAERSSNILRIATLASLTQEKVDQVNAKKATLAATPQLTKVFAVNYANLTDLQGILTKFASLSPTAAVAPGGVPGASASAGAATSTGTGAVVQLDNRTNSIVVRDYPENIERMKKLIEILDTQTPQVMIEAKIIEANESFSNDINGGFGIGGTGSTSFFASANGSNPIDPMLGTTTYTGTSIAGGSGSAGAINGSFGFSPDVSFIPGVQQLNAVLHLAEVEHQLKVVTSPKTVVLNKQKATVVESQPVLVPIPATTVPGGTTTSGSAIQQANINLTVTPTVTNDGSVLLDLSVERDIPESVGGGQTGIGNRNLQTQVLVDSGTTLVIGGVYTLQTEHIGEGMPFLRKIPIIGALFGHDSDTTTRSELFIFITPRILNMKEAGLNS